MSGRDKSRILCVSRSPYQLRAMRSAFPANEYQVLAASTPEQAVAVCLNNRVSAVVLDSEFSTEAGWSAAQTLKMVNPQLPVMLLLKSAAGTVPWGGWMQLLPAISTSCPNSKGCYSRGNKAGTKANRIQIPGRGRVIR